MRLSDGEIGRAYEVKRIGNIGRAARRLEALGMGGHAVIRLLHKKAGGDLILRARGTRWAIGRRIAEGIFVREAGK